MTQNLQPTTHNPGSGAAGALDRLIHFFLANKLIVTLLALLVVFAGLRVAPFDWDLGGLPRDPVPVDAIPDIGENQQIVFTEWMGRSPQDVEDQVTYPLTVSLLGIPGVKTVRSYSMFGFSSIYVIFREKVDFYWSRSRILERLNSLPPGTLPESVRPMLGPDATALGQVFWYTLEGRDEDGNPVGGWSLDELRSVQDWYVRYALMSAEGVSEVASAGGFVKEYQVDVDPDAMVAYGVKLQDVLKAVKMANLDVGARTIEINQAEYVIRGVGFIKSLSDIENTVVAVNDNVPITIRQVAHVTLGPAPRRGAMDKEGAEAVGGVVVVRFGENPLATIGHVKERIAEIEDGLPAKALVDFSKVTPAELEDFARTHGFDAFQGAELNQDAWKHWLRTTPRDQRPDWITLSKVTIVPFYDRTGLIKETLGTLNTALFQEVLVTVIVVLVMIGHFGASLLISGMMPMAILMTFIAMKWFHVDANVVALSGIAIAIGTIVDMGIVISESILRRLEQESGVVNGSHSPHNPQPTTHNRSPNTLRVVYAAVTEVGSAVVTAIATTVVGFLPVFALQAAEGKLFKPLAYTKTFALVASVIIALTILPALAHVLFTGRLRSERLRRFFHLALIVLGIVVGLKAQWWIGAIIAAAGMYRLFERRIPERVAGRARHAWVYLLAAVVALLLAQDWLPLGPEKGLLRNYVFVAGAIGGLLLVFYLFRRAYERMLRWALAHKMRFLSVPLVVVLLGAMAWLGFNRFFGWLPGPVRRLPPMVWMAHTFPGLGREFMPSLNEGSFLFMPTTMPHASIGEALDVLQKQDLAIRSIPEIETVVGKLGRADSPLDPAPVSMFETVINYRPHYLADENGRRLRFRFNGRENDVFRSVEGPPLPAPDGEPYVVRGRYERDDDGRLIPDRRGKPFRLWRPPLDPALNEGREAWAGIRTPDDIWNEIVRATKIPGTTTAPKLQPIETRLVMLQSGMRAPMGVKVRGPDLATIERVGLEIERILKEVPSIRPATVLADRIVGKPYLEIAIDREAIARYGIHIQQVQEVIELALGGKRLTMTVEGRERYPVRIRYPRELRGDIEAIGRVLVPAPDGAQIPLIQLADIRYVRGPQMIKSEDTFLAGYVTFDRRPGVAEVDVVEQARRVLQQRIEDGDLVIPAGVSYRFAGSYENQVRAAKTLSVVLPIALLAIFLILYMQFRSVMTTLLVFSGIFVAWAGGFILVWLYGQGWFLDFSVFGTNLRELFQVHPINLSVAVWVGFLALFGIASDNGVIVASILDQVFARRRTASVAEVREAVVEGALRRVRPALMTSATTILALLPVLTSTGRGADVMVPMAIPTFGGMLVALLTVFVVPVLYSAVREYRLRRGE